MNMLIVIDMQNDFIDGALGTPEAQAIVPNVIDKILEYRRNDLPVVFTRDTHGADYLLTQEGRNLSVEHCIKGTHGWQIADGLYEEGDIVFDKPTFGSVELARYVADSFPGGSVELVGLCTDICVISNAMLIKAFSPETAVTVDPACCAGVTVESHKNALSAMAVCQIETER